MSKPDKSRRDGTLTRIRALMQRTTANGCTEAEAADAARKVDELIALYEIDLDEVSVREQPIGPVTIDNVGEHMVWYTAAAIAKFTDCKSWRYAGRQIVYFGFQVDTEIAEYLTHLFKRAIDRESATWILFNPAWDEATKAGQRELLRSFGLGMATRLTDRLLELKSKRDWTHRGSGRDLVLMKAPAVEDAFAKMGMILTAAKAVRRAANREAYQAGDRAGDNVAINQGISERANRQQGRIA